MADIYRLYIFETLMRQGGTMALNSLWSCLSSRFSQTSEFVQIIGHNSSDFENFLRCNSALFNVDGFTVSLTDDESVSDFNFSEKSVRFRPDYTDLRASNDMNYETEALRFFKSILLKRPDTYIPIRSLVSQLSNASLKVRIGLGTKSELLTFLCRYPRVFKINGDAVAITEEASIQAIMLANNVQLRAKKRVPFGFKERSNSMRIPMSSSFRQIQGMYPDHSQYSEMLSLSSRTPTGRPLSTMIERTPISEPVINAYTGKKNNILSLTIPEFKTICWIRSIIISSGNSKESMIPMSMAMRCLIDAPEVVHTTIGLTQVEFVEFINKHPSLVAIDNEMVHFNSSERLHLIVVESQPQEANNGVNLNGKKGCVFCVSKLWGIIDLGYHEHVFFDRSLFKNVTDLQKHFKVGELLYFNAVLAAKESRAKWRATRVWKESDIIAARLALKTNTNVSSKMVPFEAFSAITTDNGSLVGGSMRRYSNMLIDALVLKQSPELTAALSLDGINLVDCIKAFASVRIAAPWEVSAIIAQSNELFSDAPTNWLNGGTPNSSGYNSSASSNNSFMNDTNSSKRRPLVEVHMTNKHTKATGSNTASNSEASAEEAPTDEVAKLTAKLPTSLNLDADPMIPREFLVGRKSNETAERRASRSNLLICAEQASQTENFHVNS